MSAASLLADIQSLTDSDFVARTTWLKKSETVAHFKGCMEELGVDSSTYTPKVLLGIVFMALDADQVFSAEDDDVIMKREACRFKDKLEIALGGSSTNFADEVVRAQRFHKAWRLRDVPHTIENLTASVVAHGVREREQGVEQPQPPEHILAQIRLLDREAEEEARRRFHVAWRRVAPQDIGTVVADAAERALWDVITERVQQGDFVALFGVLGEMRDAIKALVAHNPTRASAIEESFDVDLIKQQAEHGALTHEDVCKLMSYVVDTVSEMQAPIDDGDAREWKEATERVIAEAENTDLVTFAHDKLIPFLKASMHRIRAVYKRMMEFGEALSRARDAEAEAAQAMEPGAVDDRT